MINYTTLYTDDSRDLYHTDMIPKSNITWTLWHAVSLTVNRVTGIMTSDRETWTTTLHGHGLYTRAEHGCDLVNMCAGRWFDSATLPPSSLERGNIWHQHKDGHKMWLLINLFLNRSLMIGLRKNSWNHERVSSVFTFVCPRMSVR